MTSYGKDRGKASKSSMEATFVILGVLLWPSYWVTQRVLILRNDPEREKTFQYVHAAVQPLLHSVDPVVLQVSMAIGSMWQTLLGESQCKLSVFWSELLSEVTSFLLRKRLGLLLGHGVNWMPYQESQFTMQSELPILSLMLFWSIKPSSQFTKRPSDTGDSQYSRG